MSKGTYQGPNKYIKCPDCGLGMEIYPRAFDAQRMDHLRCGATGDVGRQRGNSEGCGALFGIQMTLEAHIEVYKMEKVAV